MVTFRSRELLVIHPGALGDVLQAVPALSALRERNRLSFACQMRIGRLLAGTGLVDQVLDFDTLGLETLFAGEEVSPETRSRLASFDRAVSWFGSREALFARRLRSVVPDVLVAPPVPESGPPPTVWEYLVSTLGPWGITVPSGLAPLALPEAWREGARRELSRLGRQNGRPLLFVHPGPERLDLIVRRVARESGCQTLIHQGPADRDAAERLTRRLDFPALHLIEPELHLLAGVIQEASVYLGGDSGVSHLAAAVGAPAVILFPPATRERWAPWSPTAFPLALSEDSAGVAAAVIKHLPRRAVTPGIS
jgi:ADP-heptose:LPS heptosyltransferase